MPYAPKCNLIHINECKSNIGGSMLNQPYTIEQLNANPSLVGSLLDIQITSMDGVMLSGLSGSVLNAVSKNGHFFLNVIQPEQVPYLTAGQLKNCISRLTPAQMAKITANQLNDSPSLVSCLNKQGIRAINNSVISGLSSDVLTTTVNSSKSVFARSLSASQVTSLVRNQLVAVATYLAVDQMSGVTADQLNDNPDLVASLSDEQIQGLSAITIAKLNSAVLKTVAKSGKPLVSVLSIKQAQSLSVIQLNEIPTYLTSLQIAGLTADQIAGANATTLEIFAPSLTKEQMANVSAGLLNESPSLVASFVEEQIQGLSELTVSNLSLDVLTGKNKNGVVVASALSLAQVGKLTAYKLFWTIACLTKSQMGAITASLLNANPALARLVDGNQIQGLSNPTISNLSYEVLTAIDRNGIALVSELLPTQVSALTTGQLQKVASYLSPEQMAGITAKRLNDAPSLVKSFRDRQLQGVSNEALVNFNSAVLKTVDLDGHILASVLLPAQVSVLAGGEYSALTTIITYVTPEGMNGVTAKQLNAYPNIVAKMKGSQIKGINCSVVPFLSLAVLCKVNLDGQYFVTALSDAQRESLSSNQYKEVEPYLNAVQAGLNGITINTLNEKPYMISTMISDNDVENAHANATSNLSLEALKTRNKDGHILASALLAKHVPQLRNNIFRAISEYFSHDAMGGITARQMNDNCGLMKWSSSQVQWFNPEIIPLLSLGVMIAPLSNGVRLIEELVRSSIFVKKLNREHLNYFLGRFSFFGKNIVQQLLPSQVSGLDPVAFRYWYWNATPEQQIAAGFETPDILISSDPKFYAGLLDINQIQKLNASELNQVAQYLTFEQIACLTAMRVGLLSTLNLIAVAPFLSIDQMAGVTANKINDIHGEMPFSDAQIRGINCDVVPQLSVDALTAKNKDGHVFVSVLGRTQVQSLTETQIGGVFEYLTAEQISWFLPDQIAVLDSNNLIIAAPYLASHQMQGILAKQLNEFRVENKFYDIQIRSISLSEIPHLDLRFLKSRDADSNITVSVFSKRQTQEITKDLIDFVYFYLTKQQVTKWLMPSQAVGLTEANLFSYISAITSDGLSANRMNALIGKIFYFTTAQILTIVKSEIPFLSTEVLISSDIFGKLVINTLADQTPGSVVFTHKQIEAIPDSVIPRLSINLLRSKGIDDKFVLDYLSKNQFQALNANQLTGVIDTISSDKIGWLSPKQIVSLGQSTLSNLTNEQLSGLTIDQVDAIFADPALNFSTIFSGNRIRYLTINFGAWQNFVNFTKKCPLLFNNMTYQQRGTISESQLLEILSYYPEGRASFSPLGVLYGIAAVSQLPDITILGKYGIKQVIEFITAPKLIQILNSPIASVVNDTGILYYFDAPNFSVGDFQSLKCLNQLPDLTILKAELLLFASEKQVGTFYAPSINSLLATHDSKYIDVITSWVKNRWLNPYALFESNLFDEGNLDINDYIDYFGFVDISKMPKHLRDKIDLTRINWLSIEAVLSSGENTDFKSSLLHGNSIFDLNYLLSIFAKGDFSPLWKYLSSLRGDSERLMVISKIALLIDKAGSWSDCIAFIKGLCYFVDTFSTTEFHWGAASPSNTYTFALNIMCRVAGAKIGLAEDRDILEKSGYFDKELIHGWFVGRKTFQPGDLQDVLFCVSHGFLSIDNANRFFLYDKDFDTQVLMSYNRKWGVIDRKDAFKENFAGSGDFQSAKEYIDYFDAILQSLQTSIESEGRKTVGKIRLDLLLVMQQFTNLVTRKKREFLSNSIDPVDFKPISDALISILTTAYEIVQSSSEISNEAKILAGKLKSAATAVISAPKLESVPTLISVTFAFKTVYAINFVSENFHIFGAQVGDNGTGQAAMIKSMNNLNALLGVALLLKQYNNSYAGVDERKFWYDLLTAFSTIPAAIRVDIKDQFNFKCFFAGIKLVFDLGRVGALFAVAAEQTSPDKQAAGFMGAVSVLASVGWDVNLVKWDALSYAKAKVELEIGGLGSAGGETKAALEAAKAQLAADIKHWTNWARICFMVGAVLNLGSYLATVIPAAKKLNNSSAGESEKALAEGTIVTSTIQAFVGFAALVSPSVALIEAFLAPLVMPAIASKYANIAAQQLLQDGKIAESYFLSAYLNDVTSTDFVSYLKSVFSGLTLGFFDWLLFESDETKRIRAIAVVLNTPEACEELLCKQYGRLFDSQPDLIISQLASLAKSLDTGTVTCFNAFVTRAMLGGQSSPDMVLLDMNTMTSNNEARYYLTAFSFERFVSEGRKPDPFEIVTDTFYFNNTSLGALAHFIFELRFANDALHKTSYVVIGGGVDSVRDSASVVGANHSYTILSNVNKNFVISSSGTSASISLKYYAGANAYVDSGNFEGVFNDNVIAISTGYFALDLMISSSLISDVYSATYKLSPIEMTPIYLGKEITNKNIDTVNASYDVILGGAAVLTQSDLDSCDSIKYESSLQCSLNISGVNIPSILARDLAASQTTLPASYSPGSVSVIDFGKIATNRYASDQKKNFDKIPVGFKNVNGVTKWDDYSTVSYVSYSPDNFKVSLLATGTDSMLGNAFEIHDGSDISYFNIHDTHRIVALNLYSASDLVKAANSGDSPRAIRSYAIDSTGIYDITGDVTSLVQAMSSFKTDSGPWMSTIDESNFYNKLIAQQVTAPSASLITSIGRSFN